MNASSVLVEEKTPGQPPSEKYRLLIPGDRLQVRDLIRAYVARQVDAHNQNVTESHASREVEQERFRTDEERLLNGVRVRPIKAHELREVETECKRALTAFQENGFFLFVDDKQVTELDDEIRINGDTTVSFLRLTPLVGG